ncbi:MAG: translation initiation factor IF-6 [Methanocalculus sp. MSAO_Arc1]|uniref:translation initiation factor IF-6 n=1 Tax=Methanocalculus TaxID=71151 RepID=UPI000FF151E2|nr:MULTISPECIES: translation initiation factor IF-6 [unclassified Methanocalculus]MCP1662057.1 translation initiation factor 6 [Methanocalculus sp. AMF5]RQD80167.1 MAG: translation initiation factor IF-6 [Methanocalculus sp. MSAO_Arc1]
MKHTLSLNGDPNIGVYCRAFEEFAVLPATVSDAFADAVTESLDVEIVRMSLQGSSIIGSLLTGNSRGMIASGLISREERGKLEEYGEVMLLEETMNAAGNCILVNDEFALVHPEMPARITDQIRDFLNVVVERMQVAGIPTVGMAAAATNKGVLLSPRATRQEIERVEALTSLPVGCGSVNMGSNLVGTGVLANSKGFVAGGTTTGFELGRMEDVFGLLR